MLRNRSSFCCCGCCRYCDARWKLAKFHRHWRGSASVWETNCQLTHPAVVKQVTGRSVGRSRGRCVRQRERKHFPALASELRRPRATNGQPDGVLYRALGVSSGRHWTNFRLRRPRLRGGACYIPTCPGRSVGEPLPRRDSAAARRHGRPELGPLRPRPTQRWRRRRGSGGLNIKLPRRLRRRRSWN